MGGRCIKCGDCCEFIAVGFTLDEVRNTASFPDRDFILTHWTPIEAPREKLNPSMSDRCFKGHIWYRCDLLDHKRRLCKNYEKRANICKEYPNKHHKAEGLISCRCGFMPEEKTL
jgi:Fe-S-cluster containining protein